MKNGSIISVWTAVLICGISISGRAGIVEDVATAQQDLSADYKEVSKWISTELTEGLAFNAGSGHFFPGDVIEFPGFEAGIAGGVSSWSIDAAGFRLLPLRTIDTSAAGDIDMPDTIGMANSFGHFKIALPHGMDIGARFGEFSFDDDEGDADITIKNRIWGFEFRKRLLGGAWTSLVLPDVSVNVSFDNATGQIQRTESYIDTQTETYDSSSYTQEITAVNGWKTDWNVQNIGAKAVISKKFLFLIPHLGIGVNRHLGSTKTEIRTTGTISLESQLAGSQAVALNAVDSAEVDADDTTVRFLAGLELKILLLRIALSGEFSGDYRAYHAGLRFQFR